MYKTRCRRKKGISSELHSQLDLLTASLDAITPAAGLSGPRLWVRRVVIWKEPGAILRDISLRPGLNIVWSPDSDEREGPIGHGGGKSSFCRLLRYCLGEDSFGSQEQRHLIGNALPDSYVGAEIMLEGSQWIVVRPIGRSRGRQLAQEGGDLETALHAEMVNTGMSPLRHAIVQAIMPTAVQHMPVSNAIDDGWESALAWLTRDQECRLLGPLEWRAPQTESRSPSRNLSTSDRLSIVRLLLNALQPEEIEVAAEMRRHERTHAAALQRRDRLQWIRDDLARGFSATFGGDPTHNAEALDLWQRRADEELERQQAQIDPNLVAKLESARKEAESKRAELQAVETRLAVVDSEFAGIGELVRMLDDRHAKASTRVRDAENPLCLSCGQPITANEQAFIAERIAERDALATELDQRAKARGVLEAESRSLKIAISASRQEYDRFASTVEKLTHALVAQSQQVSAAKGHVTTTERYKMHNEELARVEGEITRALADRDLAARSILDLQRSSQNVLVRLSGYFDAVIRYLVADGATGAVTLHANGLQAKVVKGGSLSTAAVDSLKVVAFDLAALILAIEGKAQLPGFLLHDSPREADLGVSLYYRLFDLALKLERLGTSPTFQYVITTTTAPPSEFQTVPWLRLTLCSAPPDDRLFKMNL